MKRQQPFHWNFPQNFGTRVVLLGMTLFCLAGLIPQSSLAGEPIQKIRMRTTDHELFTKTLYPQLIQFLETVYNPLDIQLETSTAPFVRCFQDLDDGKIDTMTGFAIDDNKYLFPRWHFLLAQVGAVYKADSLDKWQGYESIAGKRVGWIRGYHLNLFFDKKIPLKLLEVTGLKQCIDLIEAGRLDFCLDFKRHAIKPTFQEMPRNAAQFRVDTLYEEPVYLRMLNTPRSRKIAALFDERMDQLYSSGELNGMLEKWGWLPIHPEQRKLTKNPKFTIESLANGTDEWAGLIELIQPE